MDVLNKIINQGFDIKLTDENVIDIVTYYTMINDYKQKCLYIRTIIEAMNNKIIDADTFLTVAVAECGSIDGLLLVALALRFGANPNLYVVMQDIGVVHIMYYTVMYLRGKVDNNIITLLLCIETSLGSNYGSPATQVNRRNEANKYNQILVAKSLAQDTITVGQWLDSQGFYDFSNPMMFIKENLSLDDQINLGAMVDIPEIAFPMGTNSRSVVQVIDDDGIINNVTREDPVPGPDLSMVILYNSYNIQNLIPVIMMMDKGENMELRMCLECGALEMFKVLFNKGFRFTYFGLNRLLVLLKSTVVNNSEEKSLVVNRIYNLIYLDILKYVIGKGVRMDKEQLNLLNTFSNSYASQIEQIYQKPLWIKACSSSANIPLPEMVKDLAFSLNIDISKDKPEICSNIAEISKSDAANVKNSAISRQKNRVASDLHNVYDYAAGKTDVYCKNSSSINGNPFEYNDDSLVYYTDKSKSTWCFTPNDFENVLSNQVNPYTGNPIPDNILMKIQSKLTYINSLGINPRKVIPIGEALQVLTKSDVITNLNTEYINETIIRLAEARGIYDYTLKKLEPYRLHYLLNIINMDQDYLEQLSNSHRFATFCKAMYIHFKAYPDSISDVFGQF